MERRNDGIAAKRVDICVYWKEKDPIAYSLPNFVNQETEETPLWSQATLCKRQATKKS